MKLTQILLSLTALSFFGATATPAGNVATDRPSSLSREAIPAGATIYGLDGNPLPTEVDDVGPFSGLTKRDDCDGSGLCGSQLPYGGGSCPAASGAYSDDAWYCGYTSRVSEHCTAIFNCGDYKTCWAGWFLKEQFQATRSRCFGSQCGSTYFDDGNCRATYNYCATCKSVG